ncbi:MAG: hypothetical protein DCC43_07090 [Candidatus Brocadia sp.]|nr:hypothetical protein [Candidatus Brocadia fulgida]MCC6326685.1 cupin domain-containing protein [Candidatus Brocadia sp.]MCE7911900.1 cupin domain-containing protein [Candidatus Brocadia sp. AMX3]MDG5997663.1 cupin domain-containing protein [Candidatus Brocadia sp.]RIK00380.1 MAG: hypothetical protein DCC43_07090 [Candidatus Brocadia sp.]
MKNKVVHFTRIFIFLLLAIFIGCTTVKYYPVNFIESLQHPTKFPEVFSSNVQNIEEIASKNPLSENEDIKITTVGENKNSSMHLIQIRENGELLPHYHKRHDEVIYVKKGSGIATLDGTRYLVKSGSILQIPGKTVHKFINTGDEPFIAVSIFSPPFDGRDEKFIKGKKKTPRGRKEEKRLATKTPEKESEQDQTSSEKEVDEEEIQTTAAKSQRVADNKRKEYRPEEIISATEESSALFDKNKIAGKKRQPKETPSPEMPSIDIKDLHESLTRLLNLKEEGTISAEEYEEKKDALMKGNDIGVLPESKGYVKKKIPLEDEEVIPSLVKSGFVDKDFSDEMQNRMTDTPSVSGVKEPVVHEYPTQGEELSSEDKLKLLEEMKQEGLITEEDFENKEKELSGTMKEKTEPVMPKGISEDERIAELKELYDEGLITEDDYKHKLEEITDGQPGNGLTAGAPHEEEGDSALSDGTPDNEKVKDLKELYDDGLITEEDYHFKLKELFGEEKKGSSLGFFPEKGLENDKLSELEEMKKEGLISDEDYEFKKSQLLDN